MSVKPDDTPRPPLPTVDPDAIREARERLKSDPAADGEAHAPHQDGSEAGDAADAEDHALIPRPMI